MHYLCHYVAVLPVFIREICVHPVCEHCALIQWILCTFHRSFKAIDTLLEDNAAELPPSRYVLPSPRPALLRTDLIAPELRLCFLCCRERLDIFDRTKMELKGFESAVRDIFAV